MSYEKDLAEQVKQEMKQEVKEENQGWPRWIKYGLYSVLGAFVLSTPLIFGGNESLFFFGPISIFLFTTLWGCPGLLAIIVQIAFWFAIGGYLGKSKLSARMAAIIWLVVQVLMVFFGAFVYMALRSVYN